MALFDADQPRSFGPPPPPGTLLNPSVLIDWFDGAPTENPYFFLSNFANTPFEGSIGGFPWATFPTGEAAFQAAKATNEHDFWHIAHMVNPHEAKAAGQEVDLRPDWNFVKVGVMRDVLRAKFHPHREKENCRRLVGTADATLQEKNHWNDEAWGIDLFTGRGANLLGLLLQTRRAELALGLVRPHEEVHWAKVRHPFRILQGQQLFDHLRHQHGYYTGSSPDSEVRDWETHQSLHHIAGPDDGVGHGRDVDRLASIFQAGEWLDLLERKRGFLLFQQRPDGTSEAVVEVACNLDPTKTHGTSFPTRRGKDENALAMAEAAMRLRRMERDHQAGREPKAWT